MSALPGHKHDWMFVLAFPFHPDIVLHHSQLICLAREFVLDISRDFAFRSADFSLLGSEVNSIKFEVITARPLNDIKLLD